MPTSILKKSFSLVCVALLSFGATVSVFAQAEPARKKLVMLIAEDEYETARTLPAFAAEHLQKDFNVVVLEGAGGLDNTTFPRLNELDTADLLLISVRRRPLPPEQLAVIRRYVEAGKPVVGIRTASHPFSPAAGRTLPAGYAQWTTWDADVIGGNYSNHHGHGPILKATAAKAGHALLEGVQTPFESEAWLYRNTPLRDGTELVLSGTIPGQPAEPLAWTYNRPGGGKSFYVALGMPSDFAKPAFTRLLRNGIYWAAGIPTTRVGVNQLRTPTDVAVDLVLQEPTVAQPVFLNFDERGRMWVVQYLQYPEPAGLTAVARDSVWRIVYDKKKPAPPYDTPEKAPFRGKDRISIFEDKNGDGTFETEKTFIDGLNITSSVVRGRGGVWVLSPPQLLYYPDANNDDVPDGPPVVKIDGFNLEDTHSVANSLRWGPDGWLYGAVGSTVSADIVRPGIDKEPIVHITGQGIWRYHPESTRFEVYAEGGGNTFGVEIDDKGRVFSGHNGGNTRGFHYVQGGYLRKGFDKHGELSNPYAFGYFPQMPHPDVARFTHNFVIYQGGTLPERYRGRLIGIDPMNNYLPLSEIAPTGATFATRDIDNVISTADRRFRPVDIKHGPDGALYIADWYDGQVNHYRNHEGQITKDDGRIYRVRAADAKAGYAPFDFITKPSTELLALLRSENRWIRETVLQVLGDRRDPAVIAPLRQILAERTVGQLSLEALWALNLSGGFNDEVATELLVHPDPYVRTWTVRLLGDRAELSPRVAQAIVDMAAKETNVEARSQLAATAKRLPASSALPLIEVLIAHDEDANDPYVPLQLWWALESKVATDLDAVVGLFATASENSLWSRALVQKHLASRLMRRLAASGGTENLLAGARLLSLAPEGESRRELIAGFEQAFDGRALPAMPPALVDAMVKAGGGSLALRVRQKDPAALTEALQRLADPSAPILDRVRLATTFGEVPYAPAAAVLTKLVTEASAELRPAVLGAAAAYPDRALIQAILSAFSQLPANEQTIALSVLTSRRGSAEAMLDAIQAGQFEARAVPREMQDKLRLVDNGALGSRVDQAFGAKVVVMPEETEREITRIVNVIREGRGSPYAGREIYAQQCYACHRLHGKGGELGPDLTSYQRDDIATLVLNIANPNAEIREGYEPYILTTKEDATHTGFLASQDAERIVLRDMAGISIPVERSQISSLQGMGRSLMPDGLLEGLTDTQLRDLFAYLRITQPLVGQEPAAATP
ncbi:MAG TPA: PVC-type heme-binding CxxCH protein [Opitutaceae bacterium]